jgi:hypothetical protein
MPLWAIIAIAAVVVVALISFGAWLLGYSLLGRPGALRASATEAADRTADTAVEFWEWLRLGR